MSESNGLLEAALDYARRGWRVAWGKSGSKHPPFREWQKKATTDEVVIRNWWGRRPDAKVHIVFGPESGIIDIECDNKEGERELLELFGGDFPVTATYKSGRGKHRLFKFRDDLPRQAVYYYGESKIEFRIGHSGLGSQSVFPPSIHDKTGKPYAWLPGCHPDEAGIADIPDSVIGRLYDVEAKADRKKNRERAKKRKRWAEGVAEGADGGRNASMTELTGKRLRNLHNIFDNEAVELEWDALKLSNEKNRPPLDRDELRTVFESILERERTRRLNDDVKAEFAADARYESDGKPPTAWKLVEVLSKPKKWKLLAPHWSGELILNSRQLRNPTLILIEAIEQKGAYVARSFVARWNGTEKMPSLLERLIKSKEVIEAPLEEIRELVVAQAFDEAISNPLSSPDDDHPNVQTGSPCRLPNGNIVFLFNKVWEKMRYGPDDITRRELSELLSILECKWWGKKKLKMLDRKGQKALSDLLEGYQKT